MSELMQQYNAMSEKERESFMRTVEYMSKIINHVSIIRDITVITPHGTDMYLINPDELMARDVYSERYNDQWTLLNEGMNMHKDSLESMISLFEMVGEQYRASKQTCKCGNNFFSHRGIKYMGGVYCSSECATKNAKLIDEE